MKKKGKLYISIIISVSVIAFIFTYLGQNITDKYYYQNFNDIYELNLSLLINATTPIQNNIEGVSDPLDTITINRQLQVCINNIEKVKLSINNFETTLNRGNNSVMYNLSFIIEQFENYNDLLSYQIDNGIDETDFENIVIDLIMIQENDLFSENERSFKEIKESWERISEKFKIEPTLGESVD